MFYPLAPETSPSGKALGSSSRKRAPKRRSEVSVALRRLLTQFDSLPDSYPVRLSATAELLGGVHRTTIWRWVRENRLPSPTMIANVPTFPLGLIRSIQRSGTPPKTADNNLRKGG